MFPRISSAVLSLVCLPAASAVLFACSAARAQAAPLPLVATLSQDSPQNAPVGTLRLSARIVVLDVVVTDRKGNLVDNLTRDDFTVLEDKVPQTIRSFEPPSAHAQPADVVVHSAADLKKIGDAPVTLLVLDELNTRFEDMAFARQATVRYLQAQPAVLSQPTLLLLVSNSRFVQLHDYTQNRDELIDQIRHHLPEYPSKAVAGNGGAVAVERMAQSLASLEAIAQASTGTPGRKNVIWIGNGFPSANIVGLDDRTSQTILKAVRQCTDMLLAARITMYTINPTLNSTSTIDVSDPDALSNAETENGGDPFAGMVQFSTFAPATGGRVFLSRNDLGNEIAEGIAAGNSYYTLSYAPANQSTEAPQYRRIRIVMKDPKLRATTRDGYYPTTAAAAGAALAEPPRQARAQLQLDISSAVNSVISYNGLEVKATRDGAACILKVKAAGLDWRDIGDQSERAETTVIAAWYDRKGKLMGHSGRELTATRPAAGAEADPGDATFTLPLAPLPAAAARLRLIVRDASSGRMGTVDLKP